MPKKPIKSEPKKASEKVPSYSAKDIYVLEGLTPVRKRPGMYIGTTGVDGLHHLVWEVVDNSIDEAMAGYAKHITVELLPENVVRVTDDGRGIPVETHAQTKKSALETVMTTLHAGGKFGGESYKVSGGLHGVGVSVTNALSETLKAEVCRDSGLYEQEYKRGDPKSKVKKVGTSKATGTRVTFKPDDQIFSTIEWNEKRILERLREEAYLTKGVRITFVDARGKVPEAQSYYFEGGLLSFVKRLASRKKLIQDQPFYVHKTDHDVEVEVAFLYSDDTVMTELSFANNIHTPDGGTHLTGFRSALTRALNSYARSKNVLKEKDENFTSDDVREGMIAVVAVKIREPQFEGQTKARLGSTEAQTAVASVVAAALSEFLEKNPSDGRHIVEKASLTARARMAAKAARETVLRKGALEGMTLPGKLADCSSKHAEESELFIVEGDSAGGCFSGDTKIALTDWRNISFIELIQEAREGRQNYCYTIAKDGSVAIMPIMNVRRTKQNAHVIKVVLDTGEEIICTPDHLFMLADGSYKMAHALSPEDSLMPLYRKESQIGGSITIAGYEMIFDPAKRFWKFTHLLADEYNLARRVYQILDGEHRHHKDFNKRNNNPDNIIRLTRDGHLAHHRTHIKKTLHRPDIIEKVKVLHATKEYRKKISGIMRQPAMRAMLSERAKKQWQNPTYKAYMGQAFLSFYQKNGEYRKQNKELLNKVQKEYWDTNEHRKEQAKRVRAHFANHPERKIELAESAHMEWSNPVLRDWRREATKRQWTPEFRAQRKVAYDATYREKALKALSDVYHRTGEIGQTAYDEIRKASNDKSLLKYSTICQRFFENNEVKFQDAIVRYNHRVKNIIHLEEQMDVYDLEVPETHNFALANGVFVHNSAKAGRNRQTQAILPLRGKILNVERARIDKMLANEEIRNLVIAIGTAIAEEFDIEKLRYHKIIVMSDADVDGAHIRTLLLTLFYRYLRPIVEGGYLYVAVPPLYQVKSGKAIRYAFTDEEKDKIIAELQNEKSEKVKGKSAKTKEQTVDDAVTNEEGVSIEGEGGEKIKGIHPPTYRGLLGGDAAQSSVGGGVNIQRYKGLGEMNPDQLWETTMNPETRLMKRISIDDAETANKLFDILMGNDVDPRKKFIQTHAAGVKNLDI